MEIVMKVKFTKEERKAFEAFFGMDRDTGFRRAGALCAETLLVALEEGYYCGVANAKKGKMEIAHSTR